jgi:hypothetical protein
MNIKLCCSISFLISLINTACVESGDLFDKFDTDGRTERKFNVVARTGEVTPGALCNFDGFVVGIEKIPNRVSGICTDKRDLMRWMAPLGDKVGTALWKRVLSDRFFWKARGRKSMVTTHIARVTPKTISFNYNVYDQCPVNPYESGLAAQRDLRVALQKSADDIGCTHLIVNVRGWRNSQLDALQASAELRHSLKQQMPEPESFRPLEVKVTWPSGWSGPVDYLSFSNKCGDADEVGLILLNDLLVNTVYPVVNKRKCVLILLGHSLGARAVTRAVYSHAVLPINGPENSIPKRTVLVGFQSAFSLNRFCGGVEGTPYAFDIKIPFVFTASSRDKPINLYGRLPFAMPNAMTPKNIREFHASHPHRTSLTHFSAINELAANQKPINFVDASPKGKGCPGIEGHGDVTDADAASIVGTAISLVDK